ncbi:OLC1v1011416C1 [Oldenlandia corymbosa var. corymbosa]|uniref:OLC1v1011416C1 n=1 Tax=Oldenlandia corymbosa var. corymbosa TaxID=529605 RepID=A0AAV1DWS4_OLDCO|nr:OLC1v1011416C1 [Oldenlandia corymbosa var. corymbosa]
MHLEAAMTSRMTVAPPNMTTYSRKMGIGFNPSKPLTTAPPPQKCLISKLCSLSIQADSLPTTSWSFPVNYKFHRGREGEYYKLTLRPPRALGADAKEGRSSKHSPKPKHPKISIKERNPKRLSSSASQRVVLDYIQILKYPLITDLAMREMINNNTLTFIVDKHADKENIKAAVKSMFKIQTRKVNTLMMPDGNKKAYVMLTPDHNALEIAKKVKII